MKNNFFNKIKTRFWRKTMLTSIMVLVFSTNTIRAQESKEQEVSLNISYTEKADILILPEDSYTIYKSNGTVLTRGIGESVRDYIFDVPDIYTVKVKHTHKKEKNSCNHSFPNTWIVNVVDAKIVIDFQNITLSKPIKSNTDTQGINLIIPITVKTYNHQPIPFSANTIKTTGIGTKVAGTLQGGTQLLQEGTNTLVYNLTGRVTETHTYIMFNIIDHINRVQGWALPYPIQ